MFVLDSHCDTPSQILRARDLSKDNPYSHVDIPKLFRGKVDGAFFALYIPAVLDKDPDSGFEYAGKLLDGISSAVEANSSRMAFATSAEQAFINKEKGLFSVFLGLENGSPIGDSLERLEWFRDAGVRYITLCHSGNNQICDSCATVEKRWGGLSPFGRDMVREMNRMGILTDVSHISDKSFYDVLETSVCPVVATHSCCRSLAGHPRNMTDEMIRDMASAGGVIQINFYPVFLDSVFHQILSSSGIVDRGERIENEFISDPCNALKREAWHSVLQELRDLTRPSYKRIADHIDHAVDIAGIGHVGIGSDFDGIEVAPEGMEDISCLPVLFEELRERGYSESDIALIAGGNFLRLID